MPAVSAPTFEQETIKRKVWTRAELAAVEKSHAIDLSRFELIQGELIEKMPKNRPHSILVSMLVHWAFEVFGLSHVQVETPIDVSAEDNPTSEPEPDLIVLAKPMWAFKTSNPCGADIRLLVEISDSTLGFDLRTKAKVYARACVSEYWVMDVKGRRVLVHRDPQPAGSYGSVLAYREDEPINPLAAPETEFRLADLFKEEA